MKHFAEKRTDLWGNIPLPMAKGIRKMYQGHVEKSWWSYNVPRDPSKRAEIPLGVSQAVLEGVKNAKSKDIT